MKEILFFLLLLITQASFAQIKAITLDKASIPKTIQYKGAVVNAVRWTDNWGDNIVIATETGSQPASNSEFNEAELFAFHYIVKGDSAKLNWKLYDFVKECELDIKANFINNAFAITDLDKNGKAEVWLMYTTTCASDVSPSNMKIIMHEGVKKYAVRGQSKVKVSEIDYAGGEYLLDEGFKKGPDVFKQYALKLWEKNIFD